jgi:hypothetical protein
LLPSGRACKKAIRSAVAAESAKGREQSRQNRQQHGHTSRPVTDFQSALPLLAPAREGVDQQATRRVDEDFASTLGLGSLRSRPRNDNFPKITASERQVKAKPADLVYIKAAEKPLVIIFTTPGMAHGFKVIIAMR